MSRKTTYQQDSDFQDRLLDAISKIPPKNTLQAIRKMLEEVYPDWVLDWVSENFSPDHVFDNEKLSKWAKDNGYVKK